MCEFALDLILVKLYLLVVLEEPKIVAKTTSDNQFGPDNGRGEVEPRLDVLGSAQPHLLPFEVA